MTQHNVDEALARLRMRIRGLGSAVVAYSGGVDSTLVAAVAHQELGDKMLAVTVESELYPQWQSEDAAKLAAQLGIRHEIVRTSELGIDRFAENPPNRCYFCKRELFGGIKTIAEREGFAAVVDGANADDPHDHRPGLRAAAELGVVSPLKETGIDKQMVRAISRELGLSTAEKPAFACLASRFPYGLKITPERLEMVGQAEEVLRGLGLKQYRVRHHDTIARIEVPADEIEKLASPEMRREIVDAFKRIGYLYVTLDMEGFRSGSMNAALSADERAAGSGEGKKT